MFMAPPYPVWLPTGNAPGCGTYAMRTTNRLLIDNQWWYGRTMNEHTTLQPFQSLAINWHNVLVSKQWEPTKAHIIADNAHNDAYTNGVQRVELDNDSKRPWVITAAYIDGQQVDPGDAVELLETTD